MGVRSYEDSHSSGKRFPGQVLLKPSSKLMQFNISYGKGRAVIRPWGDIVVDNDGNASMTPWRDRQGNFGTSWFVQDDICQGWGKDFRFTCFTRCEDEQNWPTGGPLQLLYDEVKYSDRWKHLVERQGKGFSPISAPKHAGFLKGLLIEANGKNHAARPFWGTMCVFSPSAREAFDELVNVRTSPTVLAGKYNDDPYGWNSQYIVGDPIGLECGKVFEFNKESLIRGDGENAVINVDADARSSGKSGGNEIEGYGCRIFQKTPVLPLPMDKVRKYDESFVDALWFMTGEEQLNNLIIRGFGHSCRDLLLYTFGGKGVLPESYEKGKVTVDMGKQSAGEPAATSHTESAAQPHDSDFGTGNPAEDSGINLGEENPPWDDSEDGTAPAATPAPVHSPTTAAAMSTADNIKARLAAASQSKQ